MPVSANRPSYSNQTLHCFPSNTPPPLAKARFSSTFKKKNQPRNQVVFLVQLPPQAPPLCWMGNCVSGAAPALSAWLCCSPDWQVRQRVKDETAHSAANGSAKRWGRITILLLRQPPLNECVHGMRPDGGYITGRRAGLRLWRGSVKGSNGEKGFFFHCPLFIYIFSCVALSDRNSTPLKLSNMSPTLHRQSLEMGDIGGLWG